MGAAGLAPLPAAGPHRGGQEAAAGEVLREPGDQRPARPQQDHPRQQGRGLRQRAVRPGDPGPELGHHHIQVTIIMMTDDDDDDDNDLHDQDGAPLHAAEDGGVCTQENSAQSAQVSLITSKITIVIFSPSTYAT